MITTKDIKVKKHCKCHTHLSQWEMYWFIFNNQTSLSVNKEDGYFRFWAYSCKTLKEAKQYIVDGLNKGYSLLHVSGYYEPDKE